MRLRTAIVFAKDMARMTEFYRLGLGLAVTEGTPEEGWVVLDAGGGARIALHAIPPHIANNIEIGTPPVARGETPLKLVFETDDLDGAVAHIENHGGALREAKSWGRDGIDPEGNVFQLVRAKGTT